MNRAVKQCFKSVLILRPNKITFPSGICTTRPTNPTICKGCSQRCPCGGLHNINQHTLKSSWW